MESKDTRARSKNWFATWNNPGDNPEAKLKALMDDNPSVTFVCGQLEQGPSGTIHLQFYMNIK